MNAFQTLEGLVHLERGSEPKSQKQGRNQAEPKTDFLLMPQRMEAFVPIFPREATSSRKTAVPAVWGGFCGKMFKNGYLPLVAFFRSGKRAHA